MQVKCCSSVEGTGGGHPCMQWMCVHTSLCACVYVCVSELRINRQKLQRQRRWQSICWLQTEGGTAWADKKQPGRLKRQIRGVCLWGGGDVVWQKGTKKAGWSENFLFNFLSLFLLDKVHEEAVSSQKWVWTLTCVHAEALNRHLEQVGNLLRLQLFYQSVTGEVNGSLFHFVLDFLFFFFFSPNCSLSLATWTKSRFQLESERNIHFTDFQWQKDYLRTRILLKKCLISTNMQLLWSLALV